MTSDRKFGHTQTVVKCSNCRYIEFTAQAIQGRNGDNAFVNLGKNLLLPYLPITTDNHPEIPRNREEAPRIGQGYDFIARGFDAGWQAAHLVEPGFDIEFGGDAFGPNRSTPGTFRRP